MVHYTPNESVYLQAIQQRFLRLKALIETIDLQPDSSLGDYYQYITQMRLIQGNTSNDMSFIACLLAKQFLMARFAIGDFDVAEKPQGAPGLDIDLTTLDGKRIVGEIKTTVPYSGAKNNLGAKQKESFQDDFAKLNRAIADYKFFFVTDQATLRIVEQRYAQLIPGVEVVLLTIEEDNNQAHS